MGVVVVQLGQGGNQMGYALFRCLASASDSFPDQFFRSSDKKGKTKARAVLIDMEPKVIHGIIGRAKSAPAQNNRAVWTYDARGVVTGDSGSGNNWACGYYDHGPYNLNSMLKAVRTEVEQCDVFGGFIILQSMAGGTGAGLGAYLVEALKDEFPSSFILCYCIWPYESGEVIVQNYNVVLTLSHLQSFADGIIILQNEQLSTICRTLLSIQRPSFDDLNELAVQGLGCILLPSYWRAIETSTRPVSRAASKGGSESKLSNENSGQSRVRILSDLLSSLCFHPGYKVLTLRFTPQVPAQSLAFTNFTWDAQLKYLRQMFITGAHKELEMDWNIQLPRSAVHDNKQGMLSPAVPCLVNRSVASLLILRGNESEYVDVSGFADDRLYPIWQVDPLSVASSSSMYGRYELATCLISNCQSSVLPASRALTKGYNMLASRAYLHQYFEHGMEHASFDSAFASIEDIVCRYSTL
ncbi:hypothetical protein R1sor_009736 [Riccia sorocarpa]|uniref:Tubulin delta chain n=1 Tax=Riccia sorocarpa TaxID=122646 RepID=A0ABD3HZY9_9MARC